MDKFWFYRQDNWHHYFTSEIENLILPLNQVSQLFCQ